MPRYLRRKGALEHEIWIYTDGLAARGDMVEVKEEEAMRFLKPRVMPVNQALPQIVTIDMPVQDTVKPEIAELLEDNSEKIEVANQVAEPEPDAVITEPEPVIPEPPQAKPEKKPIPRKSLKKRSLKPARKQVAKPVPEKINDGSGPDKTGEINS